MAKIIVGFKVVFAMMTFLGVPLAATIFTSQEGRPPEVWYHVSMIMLILPEILFIMVKSFRSNIVESMQIETKVGIERTNKLTDYTTVICIKLFGILVLTDIWYNVSHISYWWKIALLMSAFGLEGFSVLRATLKARLENS